MGRPPVGTVILVRFPFSNLKTQKLRPALVLARAEFDDLIICQITSADYQLENSIKITAADFAAGSLPVTSFVRYDKLFTFKATLVIERVGTLKDSVITQILKSTRQLFKAQ